MNTSARMDTSNINAQDLDLHASAAEVCRRLREEFFGVPLIAMGQTPLWDEATKAVLRHALDRYAPETELVVAVHDTDYFSKLPADLRSDAGCQLFPHNDHTTRDLWAAAIELSALFGSENHPTHHQFAAHHVHLDLLAERTGTDLRELADQLTEAWGWRGAACTRGTNSVFHEFTLAGPQRILCELIDWGVRSSLDHVTSGADSADILAACFRDLVATSVEKSPHLLLTDFYRYLLLQLHRRLPGHRPRRIRTSNAWELFALTPQTAGRSRFRFPDLFLHPDTRETMIAAYNEAVSATSIYSLDRFDAGAVPFDLAIEGKGRGTIHVLDRHIEIDTPEPILIPTNRRVESVAELAELTARHVGSGCALVGKAVALPPMLRSEFIFVLNELGSSYLPATYRLLEIAGERGIELHQYPTLRLRYETWDALHGVPLHFRLPEPFRDHAPAETLSADEFAASWHTIVRNAEETLAELARRPHPRDFAAFLVTEAAGSWVERAKAYLAKREEYVERFRAIGREKAEIDALVGQRIELKRAAAALERERGRLKRETGKPLRDRLWELETQAPNDDAVRELRNEMDSLHRELDALQAEIDTKHGQAQQLRAQIKERQVKARECAHGSVTAALREEFERLETALENERARRVRNAWLTAHNLPYTNRRPSAWWFLMLSPDGRWFRNLTSTTEMYWEGETAAPSGEPQGKL